MNRFRVESEPRDPEDRAQDREVQDHNRNPDLDTIRERMQHRCGQDKNNGDGGRAGRMMFGALPSQQQEECETAHERRGAKQDAQTGKLRKQ